MTERYYSREDFYRVLKIRRVTNLSRLIHAFKAEARKILGLE
jgi:hypothetical protein